MHFLCGRGASALQSPRARGLAAIANFLLSLPHCTWKRTLLVRGLKGTLASPGK